MLISFFRIRKQSNLKTLTDTRPIRNHSYRGGLHSQPECSTCAWLANQGAKARSLILPSSKAKSDALFNHSSGHDIENQDLLLLELRTAGLDARAKVSPVIQYAKANRLTIPPLIQLILSTALCKDSDADLTKLIGLVCRIGFIRFRGNLPDLPRPWS